MKNIIWLVYPALVFAGLSEFCVPSDQNKLACFTNWPTRAGICPGHAFFKNPYGYVKAENLAGWLHFLQKPEDCYIAKDGRTVCELKIYAKDATDPKQTSKLYATLWAYKYTRPDKVPSYDYGGLYWLRGVNQDPFVL